ncbi:MAG: YHS domain-containing protein [Kiritimatiellae bacterium]|nr:YHS domain-containing protein [Kiritimatiellia bacterium]
MRKYILIIGMIAVTALLGTVALAEKEQPQPQIKCPVMEGKIDKSLFVEYDGKRVYVCCKDCIETVKKDPAKYIREIESGGLSLEKVQITCPVMGGKIDKKVYTDYNGKRVYFCCAGCIPQFKKDPGTYLKKLEAEGVVPEPVPAAADTEKKEAPKDTGAQTAPKAEHKDAGGCH